MRTRRDYGTALLIALTIASAPQAQAQVTVNPGALDLLPATPNEQHRSAPRTTQPHPTARPPAKPAASATHPATQPAAPTVANAPKPVIPTVPPAIAALPPPAPVPPARPQPAPVVPVAADAPGAATPIPTGLRVTFGPERQDLNPQTEAALRALAQRLRSDPATVNIYAYAQGTVEDPSTARRLSLGRALAARAVLINEGIASTRIYPRSIGPSAGDADKDRVDIIIGPPGPPPPATAHP